LGLWGGCQTAPQSFNHVFTSFGTITKNFPDFAGGKIQIEFQHGESK
jgi:hypothetical protein